MNTKIVIVVLILVVVLFVIFVATGALSNDKQPSGADLSKQKKPAWTKSIESLFSSLKPKVKLKRQVYSGNMTDKIEADTKQPFRTVTFTLKSGTLASIEYEEEEDPPGELEKKQTCPLPNTKGDDPKRCSIVATKKGGELRFFCVGNTACEIAVVE
jgi:hypothetical protein